MSKTVEAHVLKQYSLVREMGSGAYGHVWEVKSKINGQRYALKKVFDAFRNSIDAQRTYRQVEVLHQIEHSNIVRLYRVMKSRNNKDLYLVFEFMEADLHSVVGTNILQKMHQIFIFYQVLKGIFFIHSAELIHRDLKPSNILINSQCLTKICDFGLVRSLANSPQNEAEEVILSEQVATKWYRAPELLLGSRSYGKSVDMWSYGCIISQVLIGRPIFAGSSTINQFEKILEYTGIPSKKDIESLQSPVAEQLLDQIKIKRKSFRDYFQNIDEQFFELIEGCLQLNPQKRLTAEQALKLKIFDDFEEQPIIMANTPLIPKLNDNMRLTTKAYRQKIYQDIDLRYEPVVFRDRINQQRNYTSLQNRKMSSDSSHQNHGNVSGCKKRSSSKKRVNSATKNYSSFSTNAYGNGNKVLEKNKSNSNFAYFGGVRKLSQTKKNKALIKGSPYYKSLHSNKFQAHHNYSVQPFLHQSPKNKVPSKQDNIRQSPKYPKYQQNKLSTPKHSSNKAQFNSAHPLYGSKSAKNIKKGNKNRLYEQQKKNILKSIGVQKSKKLIKYIK